VSNSIIQTFEGMLSQSMKNWLLAGGEGPLLDEDLYEMVAWGLVAQHRGEDGVLRTFTTPVGEELRQAL
jgi:hypothetical protein